MALTAVRLDTGARILDAAFERILDVGLTRTTVEDVARAAGVSRQTIYRYYASKDALVAALVMREEERFLDGVRAALLSEDDIEVAVARGFAFCLRFARQHPLLDRLLRTDAETLLPHLTVGAGPLIVRARDAVTDLVRSRWDVRTELLPRVAEAAVRLTLSYALTPPDRSPDDLATELARILTAALPLEEERA